MEKRQHLSTAQRILKVLSTDKNATVSGVKISMKLGISRVAVWKHIKTLKGKGFQIESTSRGYRLMQHRDLLLPCCFESRAARIHYFPSIRSTMDTARTLARSNADHLSLVIAEEQTHGRGRLNRIWHSSKGGLWMTLILRTELPAQLSFKINFAVSLCLARTLKKLYGIKAGVKWPNDILVNGKKLAGILSEMETRGDLVSFLLIGIGLNVNNAPENIEPRAVSIKQLLGKDVDRKPIVSHFLDELEPLLLTIEETDIISLWKTQTITLGRPVRIETLTETIEGTAVDVDPTGALILKQDDGTLKTIIYGDCFHQSDNNINMRRQEP